MNALYYFQWIFLGCFAYIELLTSTTNIHVIVRFT